MLTTLLLRTGLAAAAFGTASAPALAEDAFFGWTAGAEANATMEAGRRFDCTGGGCPPAGLACLHARTPVAAPGARRMRQEDLTRPNAMPWKPIEAWMKTKVALLKPEVAGDPLVLSGGWSLAELTHVETLAGKPVVRRRYAFRATAGSHVVPAAFWVADQRMNILLCVVGEDAAKLAESRIAELVAALDERPVPPPPAE